MHSILISQFYAEFHFCIIDALKSCIIVSFCPLTDKSRKNETLYHPRLTYIEPEEEDESEGELYDQRSDGSYSPRRSRMSSGGSSGEESSPRRRPGPKKLNSISPSSPRKPERHSERMFDDSDDDSSAEKEGTNLNWTPAEVTTPIAPISTGTARRRAGPPGMKDPVASAGSGLINLCATVPPAPGSGAAIPPEARSAAAAAAAAISHSTQQGQYVGKFTDGTLQINTPQPPKWFQQWGLEQFRIFVSVSRSFSY